MVIVIASRESVADAQRRFTDHYGPFASWEEAEDYGVSYCALWAAQAPIAFVELLYSPTPSWPTWRDISRALEA